jgi:Phosphotransferase enzyme family
MSDSLLDQIVDSLRSSGSRYFPEHSELRAIRVVGHTPKPDYYTYEIVLDFERDSERANAKIYRAGKSGSRGSQALAITEAQNLRFAYQASAKRQFSGVPRPIGDFTELGAVVSTKINGLPLQNIIMKAALLPDSANDRLLRVAASQAGDWLQQFHKATSTTPTALGSRELLTDLERLCIKAQKDGLPKESTEAILSNARTTLSQHKKPMRASVVLNDFVPLNVLVAHAGVGFADFANLQRQGNSLHDVAMFVAAVEALEKYPFCDRSVTTPVQEAFIEGYGISEQEKPLLNVLKIKVILQMFAQGRAVNETAVRKKVMWAHVMKRFVQQAAERSMAPAA